MSEPKTSDESVTPVKPYADFRLLGKFGGKGKEDVEFQEPIHLLVDKKTGNLYIADRINRRICVYDSTGKFLSKFATVGDPGYLTWDPNGNLLMTIPQNCKLALYSIPDGKLLNTWGSYGSGNGQFTFPLGLGFDINGNLLVAEKGDRIQVFKYDGKTCQFLSKFGRSGTKIGEFLSPQGLAVTDKGNIVIADSENGRICIFDPQGKFLSKFGKEGNGEGQYNLPQAVRVDKEGNILVADSWNKRIQVHHSTGGYITSIGVGELAYVCGFDIDTSGRVIVCDSGNHQIKIFGPKQP